MNQEAVVEQERKQSEDRQWQRYQRKAPTEVDEPSERQRAYIVALAQRSGTVVNVAAITDRAKASELIERLKASVDRQGNSDERDRKVAFGLAVKLVYRKYESVPNAHLRPKFWEEVEALYREYHRRQERLFASPVFPAG